MSKCRIWTKKTTSENRKFVPKKTSSRKNSEGIAKKSEKQKKKQEFNVKMPLGRTTIKKREM